jgi:hypothetical protein
MHLYLLDNKLLLLHPKEAILYYIAGRDIFDVTESLGLEPV